MTTGGSSTGTKATSEIADLTVKGGNMCKNWPDFPVGVAGASGGLIGDIVMICGGTDQFSYFDECYSLTPQKATLVTHMSVGRRSAASIILNDNTLWVTGGHNGSYLASTEIVKVDGTMPGPVLPMAIVGHAMVAINTTFSMVIGGNHENYENIDSISSTFYYDHIECEWINGPSLMQSRKYHAAGIVMDEVTNENFAAVTGGWNYGYLDSTELLQDGKWVKGKINDFISYLLVIYDPRILLQH